MNRRDLVKAIAAQTEVDAKTVDAVLKGFTDVTTAVVSQGEPVAITGFAKFAKVERAARMGRNPATGEADPDQGLQEGPHHPAQGLQGRRDDPEPGPQAEQGRVPGRLTPPRVP